MPSPPYPRGSCRERGTAWFGEPLKAAEINSESSEVWLHCVYNTLESNMYCRSVVLTSLLLLSATSGASAAVPNRIVGLLGPAVGYMLSQSDLCKWGMSDRIRRAYDDAFTALGMTQAQRVATWDQALATQQRLADVPGAAKDRMRAETCTDAAHERVERELQD
jgi:hypothetical protein